MARVFFTYGDWSATDGNTTYYFDQFGWQEILQPPKTLHCLAILGLNHGATKDEIKQAYRRLVKIHHPDHGGDERKFQEIQTAYEEASA